MLGATMIAFFFCHACNCGFSSLTVFGFGYFAVKFPIISFVHGYNQDNQECYCKLDVFFVRETVIIRPFQRNLDCYCGYFILILFNYVRFRQSCAL